jgi:hypothetical protein
MTEEYSRMIDEFLQQVFTNQWRVVAIVAALLLLAAEAGFRVGLRLFRTKDSARKEQIGGIQGAVLGLLGLLLGFTFALAANRYDARRELVLQEANSIGTTYLRASLLSDAHKTGVEALLATYVDARIDFYRAGEDDALVAAAEKAAARIQGELWKHAVAAGRESPTPVVTSFIVSLNETIDLDAARLHALRTHVPGAVWLLVLAVATGGCFAAGYGGGAGGARSIFADVALPILIAVVITLIADIDRPRGGLIGSDQRPLYDLKASLAAGPK